MRYKLLILTQTKKNYVGSNYTKQFKELLPRVKVNEYFRFDFNVIMTSDNITY